MKTTTLCLVVSLAVSVLIVAILLQGSKKKQTKEGFSTNVQEVGMGVGIGIAVILVVFFGFFLYFYTSPKQPNVIASRYSMYYNLE